MASDAEQKIRGAIAFGAGLGHVLTHAWEDLTQRSQVEEECQPGAGGFGELPRCHQAGIPAQPSPHKMARRSVLGERVQPLHHALVLR